MNFFGFDGWYFNVEQPHSNPPAGYRANLLTLVKALVKRYWRSAGLLYGMTRSVLTGPWRIQAR